MQHHNPYSGKRKGEHYVKLDKVERDSFERAANVAADIASSRHTNQRLKEWCNDLCTQARSLLGQINESNELNLLVKPVEGEAAKEDPKKTRSR